jgi:hypothetical protein
VQPRKERYNRCCALVLELCPQHCSLRDLLARGGLSSGSGGSAARTSCEQQAQGQQPCQAEALAIQQPGGQEFGALRSQLQLRLGSAPAAAAAAASAFASASPPDLGLLSAAASAGTPLHLAPSAALPPPPEPLLRAILVQIALGMQHLHSHGIVHGELRAENVLVCGALSAEAFAARQCSRARRASNSSLSSGSVGGSPRVGPGLGLGLAPLPEEQGSGGAPRQFWLKIKDAGLTSVVLHQKQVKRRAGANPGAGGAAAGRPANPTPRPSSRRLWTPFAACLLAPPPRHPFAPFAPPHPPTPPTPHPHPPPPFSSSCAR